MSPNELIDKVTELLGKPVNLSHRGECIPFDIQYGYVFYRRVSDGEIIPMLVDLFINEYECQREKDARLNKHYDIQFNENNDVVARHAFCFNTVGHCSDFGKYERGGLKIKLPWVDLLRNCQQQDIWGWHYVFEGKRVAVGYHMNRWTRYPLTVHRFSLKSQASYQGIRDMVVCDESPNGFTSAARDGVTIADYIPMDVDTFDHTMVDLISVIVDSVVWLIDSGTVYRTAIGDKWYISNPHGRSYLMWFSDNNDTFGVNNCSDRISFVTVSECKDGKFVDDNSRLKAMPKNPGLKFPDKIPYDTIREVLLRDLCARMMYVTQDVKNVMYKRLNDGR